VVGMVKVVLASGSKARLDVLLNAGFTVETLVPGIDERETVMSSPEKLTRRLADMKIEHVIETYPERIKGLPVIAADTLGEIDGKLLFKPTDEDDARNMLKMLSGRWHRVVTGFAVHYDGKMERGTAVTRVLMRRYSKDEIEWYIDSGEYYNKAGAYAVQGKGGVLVECIEGCCFNVMGLPLSMIWNALWKLGATGV